MFVLGVNPSPEQSLVNLVDDMLVEIGVRLDPGSLLSLSRVSTGFFRLYSPVLRRFLKETKYCKHMSIALGMAGSRTLLQWAAHYFQPHSVLSQTSQVIIGAVQSGHYEFLLEYLSDPIFHNFKVRNIDYPMIHMAAGRSGRWDLILYLQRTYPLDDSMNLVAIGALETDNIPLFLKAAPIIDVTTVSDFYSFESRHSWITVAIKALPISSESFAAFQQYFKTVYERKVAKGFQDQDHLMALKKALCRLVLSAAVPTDNLGVVDWMVSLLSLTPAEFSETYLGAACFQQNLLGPIFRVFDGRFGLFDCCNNIARLQELLMAGRKLADMDFMEYCLEKNLITGDRASLLLTGIASRTWNVRSLAVMKALQALPGFTLEEEVLDKILHSFVSDREDFDREPDVFMALVAWLKSLGATVNNFSLVTLFEDRVCLNTLKLVFDACGDFFTRDDDTIMQAFFASVSWSSPQNLAGVLDYLHTKGFALKENPYTTALLRFCQRFSKLTHRTIVSNLGKVLSYFEWLHSIAIPIDSDVLSWALALGMEELSAWLIERNSPRNNNVFRFTVLVELHLINIEYETLITVNRLKVKVERLLASGYTFDDDTLEEVLKFATKENLNSVFRSTSYIPYDAFSAVMNVLIEADSPLTEKFYEYILNATSPISEVERLGMVMKIHALNCPRPPLAVSLACALSEKKRDTHVLQFLVDNGYEVTPDLTPERLLKLLFVVCGRSHSLNVPARHLMR